MKTIKLSISMYLIAIAPLQAGAWLRDTGEVFFSSTATGYRTDALRDYKLTAYGEWGARPNLTLGFDLNEYAAVNGHALMFARLPLGQPGNHGRFAAELGVGGHQAGGEWFGMYKATLSYGRQIRSEFGSGWLALDAAHERRLGLPNRFWKLDVTAGITTGRRIDPLVQIETTYIENNALIWSVTPSILVQAPHDTAWQVGIEKKSDFPNAVGLKLGFWRWF